MAICPRCKKHFRVMEDEHPGSHPCPKCGYMAQEGELEDGELKCIWCGFEGHEDDFYTDKHCSEGCKVLEEVF